MISQVQIGMIILWLVVSEIVYYLLLKFDRDSEDLSWIVVKVISMFFSLVGLTTIFFIGLGALEGYEFVVSHPPTTTHLAIVGIIASFLLFNYTFSRWVRKRR